MVFFDQPGCQNKACYVTSAYYSEVRDAGWVDVQPGHDVLRISSRATSDVAAVLVEVNQDGAGKIRDDRQVTDLQLVRWVDLLTGEQTEENMQELDALNEMVAWPTRCAVYSEGRWHQKIVGDVTLPAAAMGFDDCVVDYDQTEEADAALPQRPWVADNTLIRQAVTQLVAPGGAGKSLLTLQWAVALARGDGRFTKLGVRERARVLVVNLEDPYGEQLLRLAAVRKHFGISNEETQGWLKLWKQPKGRGRLRIASREDKRIVEGADLADFKAFIAKHQIDVVMFDPLVGTHDGNELDNNEMNTVMDYYKDLASDGNAAVLVVGHTRKPQGASAEGQQGSQDSARGASAVVNATRITMTLYSMTPGEAKAAKVPDTQRRLYCRLDDAKANLHLKEDDCTWFKRTTITLPNSEKVGVLEYADLGARGRSAECQMLASRIMLAALAEERQLSPSSQAPNSAAAYCVENQGTHDYTKVEFGEALKTLDGFDICVEEYMSYGKPAKRYAALEGVRTAG